MAARAVWQRSANRYLVQEDAAKRAPKLASSSLLSKSDTKPGLTTDVNHDFAPLNDKSNLWSDSKWWLQLQPDYMYQRGGFTSEQVNVLNLDGSSIDSMSSKSYEFLEMDSVDLPWWQMGENLIDKYDLPKPMHKGSGSGSVSKPKVIKCSSQNVISQVEMQNVTSKCKILEALCHSQTRARKAENAAKEAYAEKEDLINLLFRQASELFAYKQWVYLLQLENLCYQYQMKNNTIPSSDIGKYAVVLVVGLGIIGAGLLLGWTVGWMLI